MVTKGSSSLLTRPLKKDMEVKLEDGQKSVNAQKSDRKPPEPVVWARQRHLPPHKYLPVELLDDRREQQQNRKKPSKHSCPPHDVIAQNSSHFAEI